MNSYDDYAQLVREKQQQAKTIESLQSQLLEKEKEIEALREKLYPNPVSVQVPARKEARKDELIPWNTVLKKSHPGQLSYLSKAQKEVIINAIKEYLIEHRGSDHGCYMDIKNVSTICIPTSLVDQFYDWFDLRLDQGILSTPKASAPKRQSHAANALKENARASEIVQNFIPGNEFASTLIEIAEQEYPDVVISLSKFTQLIESFCPSPINKPLGIKVNKNNIRDKFESVFADEIQEYQQKPKRSRQDGGSKKKQRKSAVEIKQPLAVDKNTKEGHRYNTLLRQIHPNYNSADLEKRVQMKRKVKNWLKVNLGPDFKDYRVVVSTNSNDNHQTYCVPDKLVSSFKKWATDEMKGMKIMT